MKLKLKLVDILFACDEVIINGRLMETVCYRPPTVDIYMSNEFEGAKYHFDNDLEVDLPDCGEVFAPVGGTADSIDPDESDEPLERGTSVHMEFRISRPCPPSEVLEVIAWRKAVGSP